MDCRERRSHARGAYPTQDTLRMETVRVKQEEVANTEIKYGRKVRGHNKRRKSQTKPN